MLEYLQKFNSLPQTLRERISTPAVMQAISELEAEYGINLATVVMRVMVKDLSLVDLSKFFVFEYKMDGLKAEQLVEKIKAKVFMAVSDYLGLEPEAVRLEEVYANLDLNKASAPGVNQVKGSSFFFSPEDEEEVKDLAKKLELPPAPVVKPMNLAQDIVKELNIMFSSQDMLNRFLRVLDTYIRGVRNRIDTRDVLVKEPASGGLGLFENEVDQVMRLADMRKQDFNKAQISEKPPIIAVPEDNLSHNTGKEKLDNLVANDGARDIAYDLTKMPKAVPEQPVQPEQPDALKILAEEERRLKEGPEKAVTGKSENHEKLDNHLDPGDGKFKPRIQVVDSGKKKLEDVKHIPRVQGMVEEVGLMNLADFRRLDQDPYRAAAKIKEKFGLLEDEKFTKKLDGIFSWRQSPLIKMYIKLGLDSFAAKKPISALMNEFNAAGQPCLTMKEFEAINDLNKELRF